MVEKLSLVVYSTGLKEEHSCDFSLGNRGNSNTLVFIDDKFRLEICLKDIVDVEDFNGLLLGKEKKIILHATMKHQNKEYQGLRKVLLKGENLAVSIGGMRVEFGKDAKRTFLEVYKTIKQTQ
jgi:hypothetical protein